MKRDNTNAVAIHTFAFVELNINRDTFTNMLIKYSNAFLGSADIRIVMRDKNVHPTLINFTHLIHKYEVFFGINR